MSFEIDPNFRDLDDDALTREILRTVAHLRRERSPELIAKVREYLNELAAELERRRREARETGLQNGETIPTSELELGRGRPEFHVKRLQVLQRLGEEIGVPYEAPPGTDLTNDQTYENELSRMESLRTAREELETAATGASDERLANLGVSERIQLALEVILESGELDDAVREKVWAFLDPANLAIFVTIVTVFIAAGSNPITMVIAGGLLVYYLGDMAFLLGQALYHIVVAETPEEFEEGIDELFDFLAKAGSDIVIMLATAGFLKSRPGRVYRVKVRRGFGRLRRRLVGNGPPSTPVSHPEFSAARLKPKETLPEQHLASPPSPIPGRQYAPFPSKLTPPPPRPEPFNPTRTYAVENRGYSTTGGGWLGRHDFYTAFQRSGAYRRAAVFSRPRNYPWQRGPRFLNERQVPPDIRWGPWQFRPPGLGSRLRGSTRSMVRERYRQLFGREPRSDFEARHGLSLRFAESVYSSLTRSQLIEIVTRMLARAHMRTDFPRLTDRRYKWHDLTRADVESMSRDDLAKLASDLFYNNPEYIWYGPRNLNQLKGGAIMGGRNTWADLDLPPEIELFGRLPGTPFVNMSPRPGYRGVMDRTGRLTEFRRIIGRRLNEALSVRLRQ